MVSYLQWIIILHILYLLRTAKRLELAQLEVNPIELGHRWDILRSKVLGLIDFRLENGNPSQWYIDHYLYNKDLFEKASHIEEVYWVNRVPNGILAEVFFLDACEYFGFHCVPTGGDEDSWGADFKLESRDGSQTRFVDVTINTSERGLRQKNVVGTFPTLFIPWHTDYYNQRHSPTYAEEYLRTGTFDADMFVDGILTFNYRNLHDLRRSVWRDSPWGEGYMAQDGITYLRNLEGVLDILKER